MPQTLDTPAGRLPLHEYRFQDRSILHTGAVLTEADETHALAMKTQHVPYGVFLWPASIALAQVIATRDFAGGSVLELGAGTGLPGIVAASLGARVVQSDHDELVLALCRCNGEWNGVSVDYRLADWVSWTEKGEYNWIIGADILYSEKLFPSLRRIFESNLAPGGRVLLSDPFRGIGFLEQIEDLGSQGWSVTHTNRDVGGTAIGVFELVGPG